MSMKGKTRKELDRILKRDEIMRAALKLFLEKGIRDTKLEEIAESVYLTKPTIYYYFKSKDHIVDALAAKGWQYLYDVAKRNYNPDNPRESFFKIVREQMNLYKTRYELLKFLFISSGYVSEYDSEGKLKEWANYKKELMEMYENLLENLVGKDRVSLVQKAIGGVIHGILNLGRPPEDKDFVNALEFLNKLIDS